MWNQKRWTYKENETPRWCCSRSESLHYCTAVLLPVSQSTMKVSPIVKKQLSHTLWPHRGKPSVTSEVTCHCGSNFMRHQRRAVGRTENKQWSRLTEKKSAPQLVSIFSQSDSTTSAGVMSVGGVFLSSVNSLWSANIHREFVQTHAETASSQPVIMRQWCILPTAFMSYDNGLKAGSRVFPDSTPQWDQSQHTSFLSLSHTHTQ